MHEALTNIRIYFKFKSIMQIRVLQAIVRASTSYHIYLNFNENIKMLL